VDTKLLELARTYPFIDLWYNWTIRYGDELSKRDNLGYGFRGGVFYPNGARYGQHHDDWPPFFQAMAVFGLPYTGIHALYSYTKHPSFKTYWDSGGASFIFP
jgi:hypothetical protein